MSPEKDSTPEGWSEVAARLRGRAEQLRAPGDGDGGLAEPPVVAPRVRRRDGTESEAPAPPDEPEPDVEPEPVIEPEPEPEPEPDPEPEPVVEVPDDDDDEEFVQPTGRLGGVDDPEDSELLRLWGEEENLETLHPRRNWSPVIATVVVLAVIVSMFLAFRVALREDDTSGAGGPRGGAAEAGSVLDEPAPSLDDLTSEVTIPPGPDIGLSVVDRGVTIVEDRFDSARREGTFAAVIDNPNPDWLAQGIQVDVQFIDETGASVGSDNAFVELILPGQRVAVASLFFDAPTVPVADVAISIDVARWRETEPLEGGFTTRDVVTEEAEFSGVKTTFVLRSEFDESLTDVGVTAVYRNGDGTIVGGYDTFVDRLDPGVDTPVEIALLANLPLEQIASTELYPTASFGSVPDE